MVLCPTERLRQDLHSVPPGVPRPEDDNGILLILPKLNTQYLSAGDYLLRNFRLFLLESAHEDQGDVANKVKRMRPALKSDRYIARDGDAGGGQQTQAQGQAAPPPHDAGPGPVRGQVLILW